MCAKGPQVMQGYWQKPQANADAFTADGYFRTGDIGVFDAKGFLKIVDRKKDMIIVSGFNVFPNEVEAVAAACAGVAECACVGRPDEKTGEAVRLFVAKAPGATLTEADVIAHCRRELAAYKVPKEVRFLDTLPKSNVGKILRKDCAGFHRAGTAMTIAAILRWRRRRSSSAASSARPTGWRSTRIASTQFAACTGDRQWIHVDVERARRESPFGGPIAHGYLTLSLVAAMVMELGVIPPDAATGLNYGLDKVRFIAPVKAGARVRTAREPARSRAAERRADAAQAALHAGDRGRGEARPGRRDAVHADRQA